MSLNRSGFGFAVAVSALIAAIVVGAGSAMLGSCGPFTDFTDAGFCGFVLEIFYLNITTGVTPTTFDPASPVSRLQMSAFLSRTVDRTLQHANSRTILERWWYPQDPILLGVTTVGALPQYVKSDGRDVWVSNSGSGTINRVAGDGKILETWTGAVSPRALLVAANRIFIAGRTNPGQLYEAFSDQPAGAVTTLATNLGDSPNGLAFDGAKVWVASGSSIGTGSLQIVTPGPTLPWAVSTVTAGFHTLSGAVFDGTNVWVTDLLDSSHGALDKLDSSGAILQTVTMPFIAPLAPFYDGTNFWVPITLSNEIVVVRRATGTILQSLTGNGLNFPTSIAFDAERILVTNQSGQSVSLWKAADLTPLTTFSTGASTAPFGACNDGKQFWVVLSMANKVARF